jgi:hypothetical protein
MFSPQFLVHPSTWKFSLNIQKEHKDLVLRQQHGWLTGRYLQQKPGLE